MKIKARALWGFHHNSENVREGDPIEVDKETFDKLKANGLVEEDGGSNPPDAPPSKASNALPSSAVDLGGMKLEELREFAAAEGIDLGESKTKAELQAVIAAGLAAKA